MNYIKIKEAQTIGAVTKNIDYLIPVGQICRVSGTTTAISIATQPNDTSTTFCPVYEIGGFGTLSAAADGFQKVYDLIEELSKTPNTVSDYLTINGDSDLTVSVSYAAA
tara:strand:+ start:94 stop:420 length:327 start_codon:yes stop_codon:yes gene_type:complete